jgi:hypothetical protein
MPVAIADLLGGSERPGKGKALDATAGKDPVGGEPSAS